MARAGHRHAAGSQRPGQTVGARPLADVAGEAARCRARPDGLGRQQILPLRCRGHRGVGAVAASAVTAQQVVGGGVQRRPFETVRKDRAQDQQRGLDARLPDLQTDAPRIEECLGQGGAEVDLFVAAEVGVTGETIDVAPCTARRRGMHQQSAAEAGTAGRVELLFRRQLFPPGAGAQGGAGVAQAGQSIACGALAESRKGFGGV
ncbi:MAG: hypothetical protein H6R12_2165, partial [Proteobacteria bacterium]|nr:hypothetical protein [Pseudomonadota bacterium]